MTPWYPILWEAGMFLIFLSCSAGSDSGRKFVSSVSSDSESDSDSDSDADSDSDTDADADADADTGSASTSDTASFSTWDTAGGSSGPGCGDPSVSFSSYAVAYPGLELSNVGSFDLCLGDFVSGWYSWSYWDGGALAFHQGWEVVSWSSPSSYGTPPGADVSWHLEFSGTQALAGDGAAFGVPLRPDYVTGAISVAINLSSGRAWFLYESDPRWFEPSPYEPAEVFPSGSFWDVDYDLEGNGFDVP